MQIAIPLGLGIFLIWYSYSQFSGEQLQEIKSHFEKANYGIIALAVFLGLISHISRAYRWNYMLQPLGFRPKLLNNFMAVCIAYLMNIFIPKSGEVSRAMVINKYEKVPFDKAFGTIISERLVDIIILFIFTIIALVIQYDVLFGYISKYIPTLNLIYTMGILTLLLTCFILFLKYSKSPIQKRLSKLLHGLKEGVLSVLKMQKKGAFIFHTFLIWGLYLISFYTSTFALAETSSISIGTLIITFVIGSFSFAFTNSGFGSYPFFVAGILAVYGIAETTGTAFGWIVWTSNIASIVLFGALSFFMLPLYNRKKQL